MRSWVIAIARRQTRDRLRGHRLRVVDDAFPADQPSSGPGPEVTALDRAEPVSLPSAPPERRPSDPIPLPEHQKDHRHQAGGHGTCPAAGPGG